MQLNRTNGKTSLLMITLLLASVIANAQYNFTKVDVDPRANTSSNPRYFAEVNGKTCFIAKDQAGIELHAYDKVNGEAIVADMLQGPGDGAGYRPLFVYRNKLYYAGADDTSGIELCEYDGTNHPRVIYDLQPGQFSSFPYILGAYNNRLYLTDSGANKQDMYEYNFDNGIMNRLTGTTGNDITGVEQRGAVYNGKLYFIGINANTGAEPYIYDPSDSSITLLSDIYPGTISSDAKNFIVANGKLYFTARMQFNATNIFEYDGTTLTPLYSDAYQVFEQGSITEHRGKMYFALDTASKSQVEYEFFEMDIASKTITSKAILGQNSAGNLTPYNNKIFFSSGTPSVFNTFDGTVTRLDTINGQFTCVFMYTPSVCNDQLFFAGGIDLPPQSLSNIELCILSDSTVTIHNNENTSLPFTAYPNPVTGDAHLSFSLEQPQTLSVTLTNINGQVVYSKEGELYSTGKHQLTIPMQELPTGSYIYTVRDNSGTMTNSGKLLKQ